MENTNEPQQTVEPLLPNQLDMTIAQKKLPICKSYNKHYMMAMTVRFTN